MLGENDHPIDSDTPAHDENSAPARNPAGNAEAMNSDTILQYLTAQQHLHPQTSCGEILTRAIDLFGCCPKAVERGLTWLKIDEDRAIGRLRRTELVQLSRAVHRFWMQHTSPAAI